MERDANAFEKDCLQTRRIVMPLLTEAVDEAIETVASVLGQLERKPDCEAELGDLRAQILSILWLVERDPGIEAAADDLYNAATAVVRVVDDGDSGLRHKRIMNEASARFRERLRTATPSQQALKLGLTSASPR
jgi:NTP pyrophosphatase (non-canonical NTP hydrolase)